MQAMLEHIKFRARYFLGDVYYGKVEILRKVRGLNMCAVVPVGDTVHTRVRYSRGRFRVEQVIGIVKNRFGDRDRVRDFHTASLYVLARFALYNLILLYKLLLLCLNLLRVYQGFFWFSLKL